MSGGTINLSSIGGGTTQTASTGSAAGGSTAGSTLGSIGLAISIISAGISYFSQRKAKKKAKKAARAALNKLLNTEGTDISIPVIYGVRRVEGALVFIATNDPNKFGLPNEYLYLVYALCEGEVHQILTADILLDGVPTTDARFNFANSVAINIFPGLDNQIADSRLVAETKEWTANHTLSGIAYITVRLKWDRKAYNEIPVVSALVYGKKVYDPRTATTGFSTNPALCIRDYMTNTRYGKGLAAGVIDDASIITAANFYDTTVTYHTGGGATGKVFEFNAIVDTEQSILENLKDMMLCCRGFLPYSNGLYSLIPDRSASSVFAFTTSNIIGGISISGENKADKYNRMVCTFTDPLNNWQENTVIFPDPSFTTYLTEDNNTELVGEMDLPYITNYYAARDLARVFLLRSRNAIRATLSANSDALNVTVGDVVTVTHPTPGWSAKPFQVEEVAINYDGTCTVALLEYDSSIYTYDPASPLVAYADTALPNPFFVQVPVSPVVTETALISKDGTVVREIELAWTAATDAFVESYEVQFKLQSVSDYQSLLVGQNRVILAYGGVAETYDYRVRAINSLGVTSDWLTGTYTTVGDTSAPATPSTPSIVGDYNQVTVTWTAATERDYKETWLYYNETGTTPDINPAIDAPFLKVTGSTVTVSGLVPDTTYYVWARHVDFSNNPSAFSGRATFTTLNGLPVAAFDPTLQPVGISATVPVSKTVDTIYVSADSKLYRWNGTAYTKVVDDADISGVSVAKLTAGEISAAITTTNTLQLNAGGQIYSNGKTSAASATAGFFLGHDGGSPGNYDFGVGNSTKSIVWDGSAGTLTLNGDLIANGNIQTDAVSTIKIATAAVTKIFAAETSIPVDILSTYTSLGSIVTNWSSVAAEVPIEVSAIVSVSLTTVNVAAIKDTLEFRLKVGSTDYDFYFHDVQAHLSSQLCTFQILYPTSSVTGNVTVELFARCTVNPSSYIQAFQRSATLLGFKR